MSRRTLERAVGEALGGHLHDLANGIDERPVIPDEPAKSVGSENTFESDLDATPIILREILRLSDRTATRLRAKGLCGRTITLKVRFSNFKTITRSRTLGAAIDTTAEVYAVARELYERLDPDRPRIRLLGVAVAGLAPGPPERQLDLLAPAATPRWSEAARAIDAIRTRFGDAAMNPATLLDDERDR
jgi:DNA polymerase IV